MSIAACVFFALNKTRVQLKSLTKSQFINLLVIGLIICMHWLCFYQSIKEYNSSSIALICLGTGPMFVVWIEYLMGINRKMSGINILISFIALLGLFLISQGGKNQSFDVAHIGAFERAIGYGVLATFLAASFTIMNSKMTNAIEPLVISFVEMLSGAAFLVLYHLLFESFDFIVQISASDTMYILILSVMCTNIPFLLSIYSLKKLDAFIVTLTVNLEPIYGLIFAAFIFQEYENFNLNFYLGSVLILASVFLPIVHKKIFSVKLM